MAGIIDELKETYKQGSSLIKILFLNIGIFLLFRIIFLILSFIEPMAEDPFRSWFALPSSFVGLVLKPWTLISYMFYHNEIWHIVFNMLWLFWFGKIFLSFFDQKKLTALYIIGGIGGGLLYMLAYNFIPTFRPAVYLSSLIGASAAIMAIIFAVSLYAPNYKIALLFFGEVKLIYIALVSVLLDLISIPMENAGGHISHLGGALIGWLWCVQYRKGKDFTLGFTKTMNFIQGIFKPKSRLKVSHKKSVSDMDYNRSKVDYQKEIDRILDKISKAGYESLTKDEKELLFKMSNKGK
jgi:membrane associated rhomboid family serine protease